MLFILKNGGERGAAVPRRLRDGAAGCETGVRHALLRDEGRGRVEAGELCGNAVMVTSEHRSSLCIIMRKTPPRHA